MASAKDALHRLVDTMPDDEAAQLMRLLQSRLLPERFDLVSLIVRRQDHPAVDSFSLAEGIWPEDEDVDDFLIAREAWRSCR